MGEDRRTRKVKGWRRGTGPSSGYCGDAEEGDGVEGGTAEDDPGNGGAARDGG